jgi:5-aminolevulinate synthase
MNHESFFRKQLDGLRREGEYRVFADLQRHAGQFPKATHIRGTENAPVTVWCSDDDLGMGQHPGGVEAMREALDLAIIWAELNMRRAA